MITLNMNRQWCTYHVIFVVVILLKCFRVSESIPNITLQNAISMEYKNCLGGTQPLGYSLRNPITLIVNNWFGSAVNAHIAKILFEEVIGISTSFVELSNQTDNWPYLSSGDAHISLEIWTTDSRQYIETFVNKDKSVTSFGPLGIIGEIGWYVPRYVQEAAPNVLFGTFSEQDLAYFNHTFYLGSTEWSSLDVEIIAFEGWNLTIKYLNGENSLLTLLLDKYQRREPILFYFWRPHPMHKFLDLVQIQLRDPIINGERVEWYLPDILTKFVWSGLPDYSYEASFFVRAFTYTGADQTGIMAELLLTGKMYTDVACEWVINNTDAWAMWIPPVSYYEVPTGLQTAMYVVAAASIAVTGFYLTVILVKFRTKVIVAASGTFLILMCVGGALMFGAVIAWATNTTVGCTVFIWALCTGFALLFGSLFAKNIRIYMLFSNRSLEVIKYSDKDIGLGVACLVAGEWAILIAGQVVQPPVFGFINESSMQYSFCVFHEATGITLLVYNVLLIVVGIVVAALVSKLRLTLYNESRYIALAVYNFAFAAIFFVIIFLVKDLVARFTVTCCALLFIANVSLAVMFIPKLKLLFKYTPEELRKMNDEQLNAVIHGYAKKFQSHDRSSARDEPRAANQVIANNIENANNSRGGSFYNTKDSVQMSTISSFEDEISKLLGNVRAVTSENEELKKEVTELKATIARLTNTHN